MEDATFQSKIRRLLDENGKSQAMLAEYLKVSASHLSRVLKGERPAERLLLEEIAGFFDLSLEDLVAGTEHQDVAVPGRATVERETYEQLLERLREAMSAAESCEANLAGERERAALLEEQLAAAREEGRIAAERVVELEQEAERGTLERRDQAARLKAFAQQVDELTATKSSLETRIEQLEGQVKSESQRVRALLGENERLRTQVAVGERKAASMQAALQRANLQVTRNYDAWIQAESQRQELAKRLQSAPGPGAMLLTGLIGLGAGVLASSRGDDEDFDE